MKYQNIREEELKNKVAHDYWVFGVALGIVATSFIGLWLAHNPIKI